MVGGANGLDRFRLDLGVVFNGGAVGAFYCSEADGYSSFAGGDGLAVASAVGVLWQLLAGLLRYLATVADTSRQTRPRSHREG